MNFVSVLLLNNSIKSLSFPYKRKRSCGLIRNKAVGRTNGGAGRGVYACIKVRERNRQLYGWIDG